MQRLVANNEGQKMTTDRELVQAAADVLGLEYEWHHGCGNAVQLTGKDARTLYWNPLACDADAFRLANALRLSIYHAELAVIAKHKQYSWEWMGEGINEDHGDRDAATRRVIVRAAAAMAEAPAVGAA